MGVTPDQRQEDKEMSNDRLSYWEVIYVAWGVTVICLIGGIGAALYLVYWGVK